jgi:hypothetical protein
MVFGARLGDGALETALRVSAFLLVVAGAALMPGPMRAAEAGAEEERSEQAAAEHRSAHRAPATVK